MMMYLKIISAALTAVCVLSQNIKAETFELLPFGDMNRWLIREVKESGIIGGNHKKVYEIAPDGTDTSGEPYTNRGGSPWATSNVLAKVTGITKTSNAVFPDVRTAANGKCARLTTLMEHCKAIGIINIDVLVAGSMFLGEMFEPIKSTKNPYGNMEMGIPFTRRPKALRYDYRVEVPEGEGRTYSSGFGRKKHYEGTDQAEAFIILQRRWEDEDGNIYARRVGTGRERFAKSSGGWVSGHDLPVKYGDITSDPDYKPYMGLIPEERSYWARNSKGKMVPVKEVGWDAPDATPTHLLVMLSAGSGEAYIGTPGLTLWVDNVGLVYE